MDCCKCGCAGGNRECIFEKVFYIDLIRENILQQVIRNDVDDDYIMPEISRLRLVSKSWLTTISRMLIRQGNELKELSLPSDHKSVQRFVTLCSSRDHVYQMSVLPFALYLETPFQVADNWIHHEQILADCFTTCGSSLTYIFVRFPRNERVPNISHLQFSLPNLQNFSIVLRRHVFESSESREEANYETVAFIQTILDATTKLVGFGNISPRYGSARDFEGQNIIANIRLPPTLSQIRLENSQLEMLVRNPLPNLSFLEIEIKNPNWNTGLVSEILEKFNKTLTYFRIQGCKTRTMQTPFTTQLPLMQSLKSLIIGTINCSLEPSSVPGLHKCLPVLEDFALKYQTQTTWLKWMKSLENFETIKDFQTSLLKYRRLYNLSDNQVMIISATFPNLQSLTINVNEQGMEIIFREMSQLKKLTVFSRECSHISKTRKWTCVLLGISGVEYDRVNSLSRDERWTDIEPQRKENAVSILNLTELQYLELGDPLHHYPSTIKSSLSPLSFYFGFMRMPNLTRLQFRGRFKPSSEMITEWTEVRHGVIDYKTRPDEDDYDSVRDHENVPGDDDDDDGYDYGQDTELDDDEQVEDDHLVNDNQLVDDNQLVNDNQLVDDDDDDNDEQNYNQVVDYICTACTYGFPVLIGIVILVSMMKHSN